MLGSYDIIEELETVNHVDVVDRNTPEEHIYVQLSAPSEGLNDPATLDIYINEHGMAFHTRTDVDYSALFNILDEEYPIREDNYVWATDEFGATERSRYYGLGDDLRQFQLKRFDSPEFDIQWIDMSDTRDHLSFTVKLECYDQMGLWLDHESAEPIGDFIPTVIRSDTPSSIRSAMMRDIISLVGQDTSESFPMAYYLDDDEFESLVENTAKFFDPHR
ncbi:MAG: hypothetical protein ABEJ99_04475 [Candidatus Nanohaloarchaea archaeon]